MRKTIAIGISVAVLGLGALGTAAAQAMDGFGPGGMRHFERLADKLALSDSQRDQVEDIMFDNMQEMHKAMREVRNIRRDLRTLDPAAADYQARVDELARQAQEQAAQLVRLRAGQRQEVHAVLTSEQQAKFAELGSAWEERAGQHREGKGHHGRGGYRHCD